MLATVTCRTKDCGNEGEPISLEIGYLDDDGIEHEVDAIVCGVCGNPIETVVREP